MFSVACSNTDQNNSGVKGKRYSWSLTLALQASLLEYAEKIFKSHAI